MSVVDLSKLQRDILAYRYIKSLKNTYLVERHIRPYVVERHTRPYLVQRHTRPYLVKGHTRPLQLLLNAI